MKTKFYILTLIAVFFSSPIFSQLYINEIVTSNSTTIADPNGEYDDWIEIYNNSSSPINLADYYLSDDPLDPTQFKIPNSILTTVPANGYLLFWADNDTEQGENHTNFKLSAGGGSLHLYHTDGTTIVDEIIFPSIVNDSSYGRLQDGGSIWEIFATPSPTITNTASQAQLSKPVMNPSGGFYSANQTVSITTDTGASIYYTTDGSEPTSSSLLYTNPISIDSTSAIRSISVKNGSLNSLVETESYIINSTHDLPIVAINLDPKHLWSDTEGMYVVGTNGTTADCSGINVANFWQEWEYPTNVILFDEAKNKVFDIDGGLSIAGNCSRRYAQKSIQFKTKNIYPSPNIPYQIFPQKEQNEFRRLRFRSGGNHWKTSIMGEAVMQSLAENTLNLEIQSARPAVVYLNKQYWGIHNIREGYSKHYFEYKFPEYKNDQMEIVRIAKLHTEFVASEGTPDNLESLYQYFDTNLSFSDANYEYAASQIDIDNFLNYYMLQMWVAPGDWPATYSPSNKIYWRSATSNSKWRMAVLDTDVGWNDPGKDVIEYMMTVDSTNIRNIPTSTMLYRRLMGVSSFKNEFIQRYATQLNLVYDSSRVNSKIDDYKNKLNNEIPAHTALWGPQGGVANHAAWVNEVDNLKAFADVRSDNVRNQIANFFNLSTVNLTTNFNVNSNGKVAINSNYFELPYNYSGLYFRDTPIEIHAIPAPGYRFLHWQETGDTNAHLYQSFNSNTTLTPVFEPVEELVINEIHYNPNDTINKKEFIEIYNPDNQSRDISKYRLSAGIQFEFPEGTIITPNEYIIIAEDSSQYQGNSYQVFEWGNSGLDKNGENLVFQNPLQQTIDSIFYNDKKPWDEVPDGQGYSLELLHPSFNKLNPLSWFRSDGINGTPGAENSRICNTTNSLIVINEINYNSDNLNFDPSDWVELYNPNPTSIDLSGWTFYNQDGKYVFPQGTTIPAKSYLLLVEDATFFNNAFTNLSANIFIGNLPFSLSNKGERLSLFDKNKCLVDYVIYNDVAPWAVAPDGGGATLSLVDPSLDNALAPHWEASDDLSSEFIYGSPGKSNLFSGVNAKLLLEGFYDISNGNMHTKLKDKNLLPLSQPFNRAPWNYNGTENTTSIPSGVTDWILIATRDSNGDMINQAAGFINQYGALISVDGHLGIPIPDAMGKTISVHHKSHLAVMSSSLYDGDIYDFTTRVNQAEGIEQLKLIDGKYMLYSGDYDNTGIINSNDFNKWKIQSAVLNQYLNIDGDGNGIINSLDYNLWQNNKSKVGQPSIRY